MMMKIVLVILQVLSVPLHKIDKIIFVLLKESPYLRDDLRRLAETVASRGHKYLPNGVVIGQMTKEELEHIKQLYEGVI